MMSEGYTQDKFSVVGYEMSSFFPKYVLLLTIQNA